MMYPYITLADETLITHSHLLVDEPFHFTTQRLLTACENNSILQL